MKLAKFKKTAWYRIIQVLYIVGLLAVLILATTIAYANYPRKVWDGKGFTCGHATKDNPWFATYKKEVSFREIGINPYDYEPEEGRDYRELLQKDATAAEEYCRSIGEYLVRPYGVGFKVVGNSSEAWRLFTIVLGAGFLALYALRAIVFYIVTGSKTR